MLKSCSICSHSILASFVCFLFGQMQIGFRLCLRLQFRSQIIFSFLLFSHNFGLFILVLNSCFLLSLSFLESIKGDLRVSVPLTLILISKVYPVSKLFFFIRWDISPSLSYQQSQFGFGTLRFSSPKKERGEELTVQRSIICNTLMISSAGERHAFFFLFSLS